MSHRKTFASVQVWWWWGGGGAVHNSLQSGSASTLGVLVRACAGAWEMKYETARRLQQMRTFGILDALLLPGDRSFCLQSESARVFSLVLGLMRASQLINDEEAGG